MPFSYHLFPLIDFLLLGILDRIQIPIINTAFFPNFATALFTSLFFISPIWFLAIWKITIPNCKIKLFPAFLGLFFVILAVVFVYYVYVPHVSYPALYIKPSVSNVAVSLHSIRDFTVKSFVFIILLFQIFPITLHFRKNTSRSFLYSIFVRLGIIIVSICFANLIGPPIILANLFIVLPVIILFESARVIRRYVVIENGKFQRITNTE